MNSKKTKFTFKLAIAILLIAVITIAIYFIYKKFNKNIKLGNNLSNKTIQEIEEYILNISSYEAEIQVEIETNKNNTKYKIKQSFVSPNTEKQTVLEPSNISGLQTIYDGNTLTINNTNLNLSSVYQNYQYITENFLWLNSFINDYKNSNFTKLYEENNFIIMEVNLESNNPYVCSKKLFIDKTTGEITKLIVQDKNQKNLVYILYNEIEINSLQKEDVLAFRVNNYFVSQY